MVSYLAFFEPLHVRYRQQQERMSRFLTLIFLALWACGGAAQDVDLYAGVVPVGGTGAAERQEAMPLALKHVLRKLSGLHELPPSAELDQVLEDAASMAVAFYYEDRERQMPDGGGEKESVLVVNFLPEAADRALRQLGLPRWRTERPPIMFWVAIDDGQGRRLMPVEYAYAWDAMNRVAEERGLPIAWPEFDPEQPPPVDLQLLWGGFTEQLPSGPGHAGGHVIVTARRTGPAWRLRWTYDNGIETAGWNSENLDLSLALTNGLHRLTDIIAESDSIRSVAGETWNHRIVVSGLEGADDYARCLSYLGELSLVDKLSVETASPGQVGFALVINAEPQYLEEVIIRDRVLAPGVERDSYLLVR
jgi:hypothetical protein